MFRWGRLGVGSHTPKPPPVVVYPPLMSDANPLRNHGSVLSFFETHYGVFRLKQNRSIFQNCKIYPCKGLDEYNRMKLSMFKAAKILCGEDNPEEDFDKDWANNIVNFIFQLDFKSTEKLNPKLFIAFQKMAAGEPFEKYAIQRKRKATPAPPGSENNPILCDEPDSPKTKKTKELEKQVLDLTQKLKDAKAKVPVCPVCYNETMLSIFKPCGHPICKNCFIKLAQTQNYSGDVHCVVCKTPSYAIQRIYL